MPIVSCARLHDNDNVVDNRLSYSEFHVLDYTKYNAFEFHCSRDLVFALYLQAVNSMVSRKRISAIFSLLIIFPGFDMAYNFNHFQPERDTHTNTLRQLPPIRYNSMDSYYLKRNGAFGRT